MWKEWNILIGRLWIRQVSSKRMNRVIGMTEKVMDCLVYSFRCIN